MLMAHPTVLRNLMERYETLRAQAETLSADGTDTTQTAAEPQLAQLRQQLQDTVYTLCVSTGTREIGPALAAARRHVERYAFAERGAVGTASVAAQGNAA